MIELTSGQVTREVWNLIAKSIFGGFGVIGNILLFITYLCQKDIRIRFNGLVMTLAIFDFLYICICFRNFICLYFKFYSHLQLFFAFESFLFDCSAYTVTIICIERYLVICRNKNTDTYSFFWILVIILAMSALSSINYILDLTINTINQYFMVKSAFPTVVIILCKAMLYKRLRFLLKSGSFTSATKELKKAVFQAKMANAIALILFCSLIIEIINSTLLMVIFDEENRRRFCENPMDWRTMYKCYAYLIPIIKILKLGNSSVNFYVYQYLLYRNE